MPESLLLSHASVPLTRPSVGTPELIGRSPAACRLQELVRRAAGLDGGVLLMGDRGVDVGGVARELHERKVPHRPYVAVDCGGSDATELERLLFGNAAPDAADLEPVSSASRLAAAVGGTLFLRDVGDVPALVQARLARLARDGEIRVDGEPTMIGLRLIASALPGIDQDVRANRFRSDLYRRLSMFRIELPSLRDRADDVSELAEFLLADCCAARALTPLTFTHAALALLGALTWPGNLAELAEVVDRVATQKAAAGGVPIVQVEDVLPALELDRAPTPPALNGTLREARLRFERDYIAAVLQRHGWRMAEAAKALGIQRPNLYRKARQLGIPVARMTE
jgi:DNA-binding NtrC family response regulator